MIGVALLCALLLVGCGNVRGTGASESWSGIAAQEGANTFFVGTRDGRLMEIILETSSSGVRRPVLGSVFNVHEEREEGDEGDRTGAAFYGTPTVANGRVYVGSYQGFVYSLRASGTGEGPALSDVGGFEVRGDRLSKAITGEVLYVDGSLVVAAAEDVHVGRLYVLDAQALDEGRSEEAVESCTYPRGTQEGVGRMWSSPIVVDGIAYFGDLDHQVHAVRVADCQPVWDQPAQLDGAVAARPLILNGKIYIGSFDEAFYEIDVPTGAVTELFQAGNWFWAGAITDGTYVYVPNLDGRLYAWDPSAAPGSNPMWVFDQDGDTQPIVSRPAMIGDRIVLASDSGTVYLVGTTGNDAGERVHGVTHSDDMIRSPVTVFDNTAYVHSLNEFVMAFTAEDNRLEQDWEFELPF